MCPKIRCDGQKPKFFGTKRALSKQELVMRSPTAVALTQQHFLAGYFSKLQLRYDSTCNRSVSCFWMLWWHAWLFFYAQFLPKG